MYRFCVPPANISGTEAVIDDAGQLHHLRDVLRLRPGDRVELFDGEGGEYDGTVIEVSRAQARFSVLPRPAHAARQTRIVVACALPRKGMDELVDNLTQLGVDEIVPLVTARVVARPRLADAAARHARWQRIAQSAAMQSHRDRLPAVAPLSDLPSLLRRASEFNLKLIPTLFGHTRPVREAAAGINPSNVLLLVGPEGDFTPEEVDLAIEAGCVPVSLGRLVMRVGTAAVAAVSYLRLSLD